jgi:hypothetical protein
MLRGKFDNDDIRLAGAITARYADLNGATNVRVKVTLNNATESLDNITPLLVGETDKYHINQPRLARAIKSG